MLVICLVSIHLLEPQNNEIMSDLTLYDPFGPSAYPDSFNNQVKLIQQWGRELDMNKIGKINLKR